MAQREENVNSGSGSATPSTIERGRDMDTTNDGSTQVVITRIFRVDLSQLLPKLKQLLSRKSPPTQPVCISIASGDDSCQEVKIQFQHQVVHKDRGMTLSIQAARRLCPKLKRLRRLLLRFHFSGNKKRKYRRETELEATRIRKQKKKLPLIRELAVSIKTEFSIWISEAAGFLSSQESGNSALWNMCKPSVKNDLTPEEERQSQKCLQDAISLIREGSMTPVVAINWKKVAVEFETSLAKLLSRGPEEIFVKFLDVTPRSGPDVLTSEERDWEHMCVDDIWERQRDDGKEAVAFVAHDKQSVLLSSLSPTLCKELYLSICDEYGVDPTLTPLIRQGIRRVSTREIQKATGNQEVARCANYGSSVTAQCNGEKAHDPLQWRDKEKEFDGPLAVTLLQDDGITSIKSLNSERYQAHTRRIDSKHINMNDRWRNNRSGGQRFKRHTARSHRGKQTFLMYPLKSSIPRQSAGLASPVDLNNTCVTDLMAETAAAAFENDLRSISEVLLKRVFGTLPYSLINWAIVDDMQWLAEKARKEKLPGAWGAVARPLPKGTLGWNPEKALHDDNNAVLAPGIWTAVTDESLGNKTDFQFWYGDHCVEFAITKFRFAAFCGWTPHKTTYHELDNGKRKQGGSYRLSHSAYMKPETEHQATAVLRYSKDGERINEPTKRIRRVP